MRRPDPTIRIAVTGAGIICSIGRNQSEVWESIVAARAGIAKFARFPNDAFPTDIAAQAEIVPSLSPRGTNRLSRTDLLAVIAAKEALAQAGDVPLERAVISTGTSTGGLLEGEDYYIRRLSVGRRRARASRVLQQPTSAPSDAVARTLGLGGGAVSNATACASAGAAIGLGADYIRAGYADVAIAGGSDALCRLTYSGFNVLQAVDPEPCSPFGATRKGITLGEGAVG